MYRSLVVSTVLAILFGAASVAHANIEVGGVAGLHVFSDTNGLGVGTSTATTAADSQKNSAFFGLRLGYYFNDKLGIEVEGGIIPTEPESTVFDITDLVIRGQV